MKGLWKNNLSGWNNKDTKRKSQTFSQYRKENAKSLFRTFSSRYNRNTPKLKGRVIPFIDLEDCHIIYGKEVMGWEYQTFGLDGSSGSKHRKRVRKDIKRVENAAVSKWIKKGDWEEVLDYRGIKKTVSWDMY